MKRFIPITAVVFSFFGSTLAMAASKDKVYLEINALSYVNKTDKVESTTNGVKTSLENKESQLEAFGGAGSSGGIGNGFELVGMFEPIVVRLGTDGVLNKGGLGFHIIENIEIGLRLGFSTRNTKGGMTSSSSSVSTTIASPDLESSGYNVGPYVVYALPLDSSVGFEFGGEVALTQDKEKETRSIPVGASGGPETITTENESSGWKIGIAADAVYNASEKLEFLAGIRFLYGSSARKAQGKTPEVTTKTTAFGLNLASVRFKF